MQGNAVLKNLDIKENALSQLDIPFKVKAGHIEKLELKIPWQNLYTQPVEATLIGVYLLIVPTASIKYDSEKEDKQLQEARQRELQRIEETKQKAAERENPKQEKQDTFVEKLVTQVIKNLQVKISNIHIRYEDDVTNPKIPLSFGVSLQNLSLQTADASWNPCVLDQTAKLFFKLVRLDNLFTYWNVNSELYSNHVPHEALENLKHGIALHNLIPEGYDFIFRPISAKAKLKMNPRSDIDFSSPKVDLQVNLQDIAIELSRPQYHSILELLGSVDRMTLNLPYRKYRPDVPVHYNAVLWWKYIITGILEVNVKPRLRMWSWKYIHLHRQHVKEYKEKYKRKITNKEPSEQLLKSLMESERTLDIFNITLARQQAEMEASKAGLKIYRPGVKMDEEESGGWFGWMWNWSGEKKEDKEIKASGFEELMTPEEKAKLYKAIGYSETAIDPTLPKEFEAMKVSVQLISMSVSIKENKSKPDLLRVVVIDLGAQLTQRPGAQAVKFSSKISTFEVIGLEQNKTSPMLLSQKTKTKDQELLSVLFETNPLDESADQRLRVESQPLEIVYDAVTLNSLSEFFRPPQDVHLDELTSATLMKLEEFRDKTSTGLMYVIETQKVLDLKINLNASYVIIPQTGFYTSSENLLILDLGHLKVKSKSRKDLPQLSIGHSSIEDIMSRAYDSFDIQLSSVQLLFSKPDENWKEARNLKKSSLHILEPLDLKVEFSRAMVATDSRMPKFKAFGELPLLSFCISDEKLRGTLALIDSIPLASSSPPVSQPQNTPQVLKYPVTMTPQLELHRKSLTDLRSSIVFESESEEEFYDAPSSPVEDLPFFDAKTASLDRSNSIKRKQLKKQESIKNMTSLQMRFEINVVSIQLSRLSGNTEITVLQLEIEGLGTELNLRTFDMTSNTFLKEICLKCPEYMDTEEKPVQIITTLDNTEEDLLTLEYIKADKNGPEFTTQYKNTEQLIKFNFSSLDMHLHTEALLNAVNFLNSLLPPAKKKETIEEPVTVVDEEKKEESTQSRKMSTKKSKFEDVVNMHVCAVLTCLKIFIRGQKRRISEISIEGLDSEVVMRKKATEVMAKLKNIVILDCHEKALYKKAVSIVGKEVFSFKMISYVDATEGDAYTDMNIVDSSVSLTVGCIQVIFVNKFVSSILAFINNFQTAKEAVTEATVQAAGKAATGVLEMAEKSTRMALDVNVKAPVVFIPQSAMSTNVIVADFGLITVKNQFSLVQSKTHIKIPPIIDGIKIGLSDLKLYRTTFINGKFQFELQLLQPVNLDLVVERNLSSSWYHSIPDIKIIAHLKPMNLILSQEDLTVVLRTLNENLQDSEDKSVTPPTVDISKDVSTNDPLMNQKPGGTTVITAAVVEAQKPARLKSTLKLNFQFDSLTLVLYSSAGTQITTLEPRDEHLKLAQFTLGLISTSVTMLSDSSMKASVKLSNCLLDDKRQKVQKASCRMVEMKSGSEKNVMVDINYRQSAEGTVLDTVVRDIYLCASMEFLLTVADVFVQASQHSYKATQNTTKQVVVATKEQVISSQPVAKMEINVQVKNPEIVFVADLSRGDAPSLVVTTQCEVNIKNDCNIQQMTAAIKDLKVVACPFLTEMRRNNITTVLHPCDVFFQSLQNTGLPQEIELAVKSLTLKVSPIIINTVLTIISALYPTAETPAELTSPVPPNLWDTKDAKDLNLWFLEEQTNTEDKPVTPLIPTGESLKMNIESIIVTLEAGIGHRTVPMLLAKSSFSGDVKNWSTLINLQSSINLEVHYFNEILGVWEPLLEPLEKESTDDFRPWALNIKMKKKPLKHNEEQDETDFSIPDYKTVVTISSKDQLNMTLSNCGLVMLSNLGKAFADAASQTAENFQKDQAPFVVKNCLGTCVSISHSNTFSVIGVESRKKVYELQDGGTLNMDYLRTMTETEQFTAMTCMSSKTHYIQLTPNDHSSADRISLEKVGRGMYSVLHQASGVLRYIVCHIYTLEGSKVVTIHSPFQIRNHFSIPFKVFDDSKLLGVVLPQEDFCIPLNSYRSALTLQPEDNTDGSYEKCEEFTYDIVVKQLESSMQRKCHHSGSNVQSFIINLVTTEDSVTVGAKEDNLDKPYTVHLWPTVLLRNLLPYSITYSLEENDNHTVTVKEGRSSEIHTAVIDHTKLKLCLLNYLNQDWRGEYNIKSNHPEIDFIQFSALTDDDKTELDIAIHITYNVGQMVIALHSPYWMVNKTGRLLQYKADDVHRKHPLEYESPLLFSFKPKNFFQNNKVQLMISDSELSDGFSLDTVGSYGDVKCKGRQKDFMVGVKIDASSFSLTRIVTFIPFYMLVNRTQLHIEVSEEGKENWTSVTSNNSVPFWPEKDSKKLMIKILGCEMPSQMIDFCKQENGHLLHLDNKFGGVIVDVNVNEHSSIIRFSDYHDGAAPFLIINQTKSEIIEYYQSKEKEKLELHPGKAVYYTWTNPTKSRILKWKCGKITGELHPEQDNFLEQSNIYLASFYEGLQRVALFTEDIQIYRLICDSEKAQLAELDVVISLQNIGISLVNNNYKQEVSFIGITSSDIVWETKPKPKSRWKPMSIKHSELLEGEFRRYIESGPVSDSIIDLAPDFQVCLTPTGSEMKMFLPNEAPIRRNFLPALKVEYSVSARQKSYRIQLYRIQIQNQLPGAIFPFVFFPVKPPKSVTMDSEPKPLADVSIVTRSAGHSNISRIKYFKVLIQEMDFKMDMGFLYALTEIFTQANQEAMSSGLEVELFEKDVEYLKMPLDSGSSTDTSPVSLYEYFHISPIKLHLSFSLSTGGEDGNREKRDTEFIPVQSLNLLLKSIGATLTDVQDVIFKLGFFELTYQFCTTQQLQWEVIRHYSKQAIKQMYVLVLGLDVLGNPFGLIRGLSEGVEAFFYEPYQGAIQGPEEFVEGMALGVKALVGGAVGGIAGAASRITGAMAKGVAAITMDEDYQQKRREEMNRQPSGLREGITRGGKGLVSGFVSGITGIVTKPIKGAQKEGATGFFKGVGKGLVGAVARPAGGIIDMASSTFQGIKRATESSEEVESLRPPRFIHEDGVIRPYREREGFGSQMLQKIENGRFAKYRYFAHAKVNDSDFFMITKSCIFFVTKGTFGQLTCEWQYCFDEFTKEPVIVEGRRLRIEAKERVKSVFHAKEFGKIINFKTPEIAKWVLNKLEDAREILPKC
ncbi:vacuolar protein sorting-associated protein 13A isoform X2 [Polypterus senegalus]|uniref:vacuolar protein sorting-associated protein 13A isoform X2 n=1 Tax=Polypterus senegalus TaxID=55291 RepID=UPI001962350E|nr:vacuolar protein sorting-associated protein 13A isoform X2 [Polypterus senegalus]